MQRLGRLFAVLTTLAALATPLTLHAQPGAAPRAALKVAVVVVGDADPRMREAAVRVEDALVAGGLQVAVDSGLRAALRGEPAPTEDDGLASARRLRRALGLSEANDAPNLARLGRIAGAVIVVAVRGDGRGGVELVALQVEAAQFYEGALDAERTEPTRIARAVERRAQHAIRASATANAMAVAGSATTEHAGARRAPRAATAPDAPPAQRSFLEKSWPYFVVGVLFACAVTYVVFDTTSGNETAATPVLRFSPGP